MSDPITLYAPKSILTSYLTTCLTQSEKNGKNLYKQTRTTEL